MTRRWTENERACAVIQRTADQRGVNAEEAIQKLSERFERRQCCCCGADSGTEPLLPPGWSFAVFRSSNQVAAYFCPRHAIEMGYPEDRAPGADCN